MGPTFSPCPRPILKRPSTVPELPTAPRDRDEPTELLAIDRGILQPVVRFPARTALARTFSAHSSAQYDRSPIVVQHNSCALPARGCPGRTYSLDDPAASSSPPSSPPSRPSASSRRSPSRAGRHLHPRAAPAPPGGDDDDDDPTPRASPLAPLPALVPDLSSESDESDGFTSPPNELIAAGIPMRAGKPSADALTCGLASFHLSSSEALAFLPHPPSPPRMYGAGNAHAPETDVRAGRHARPGGGEQGASPTRKRHSRTRSGADASARYKALSEGSRLSGCSLADDLGCLGGF